MIPIHMYEPHTSARNGMVFSERPFRLPTLVYAAYLDCLYEMADMVATGNGVSHAESVERVIKDEGWPVLKIHRSKIAFMLKDARS